MKSWFYSYSNDSTYSKSILIPKWSLNWVYGLPLMKNFYIWVVPGINFKCDCDEIFPLSELIISLTKMFDED